MRVKWFMILAALALLAAGGFWALRKKERKAETITYRTIRVERGDLQVSILATGIVQPRTRVEIKPPLGGRVEDIRFGEGQSVQKGEVVAWMSSVERAALLDAARAKGPEELAHWEQLYKPMPLVAPLNGVIIARNVEPGQSVSAQDAVLVMSDRLIVQAQVDETDIGQVRVGQSAEIVLDAYPSDLIPAQVSHIAYEARTVNNVTIYEVDITPGRVPPFMRSGMTANVTMKAEARKGVLVLPAEAIRQEDGHAVVSVPGPTPRQPGSRSVETGVTDGKRVEIRSGLAEGDVVLMKSFRIPSTEGTKTSPFMPWGQRKAGGKEGKSR
ncbi:MAG: efflux RND transporter periplasmic adaptor subunit [Nitrospirae bacterium]|nr:efflux RND transporter periplasmic adaptor subunit [Nitrospirota bacterium]